MRFKPTVIVIWQIWGRTPIWPMFDPYAYLYSGGTPCKHLRLSSAPKTESTK